MRPSPNAAFHRRHLVHWHASSPLKSISSERPSLRQRVERLREFAYPRPIGTGKALSVAPARVANGNPAPLAVDEIAPLAHGDKSRQHFKERRQTSLILAERIAFADRRFRGCRNLRTIDRRVGRGMTRAWCDADGRSDHDNDMPSARMIFHGAIPGRGKHDQEEECGATDIGMARIDLASQFGVGSRGGLQMLMALRLGPPSVRRAGRGRCG